MTRTEQIQKAAMEHASYKQQGAGDAYLDFVRTAEWADRTLIEKVYKWMREEFYTSKDRDGHNILVSASCDNAEELIKDFEKQMEE